jgi:acetylglutamate/LysW-gamma-L-alpha-aminoadipate kinase
MILIKVGGGKHINWDYICEDIQILSQNEKLLLVHGASSIRDEIAEQMGYPTKRIASESGVTSIYTDEKALEIFMMVYAGLANKKIVAKLHSYNINAVGLSGIDGRIWQAKRKKYLYVKEGKKTKLLKGSYTGRVESINTDLIKLLVDNDYLPVITPPAIGNDNEILNTDNDWACAVTAASLGIQKMVVLFEAPGLLQNSEDEHSLIKRINKDKIMNYLDFAQGTMKKKVLSVQKAIEGGIKEIYWGDGRIKNPILKALDGNGTVIN